MRTILAIQPTGRHLGYAVLKGATLVAFGTKFLTYNQRLPYRIHQVAMPFFRTLIEQQNPDIVIVPVPTRPVGSTKNRFLRALRVELIRRPLTIQSFSRRDIQQAFEPFLKKPRPSKDAIMTLLTRWFPKLATFLPVARRAWDSADYWVYMFDAVSLAVTFLHHDA